MKNPLIEIVEDNQEKFFGLFSQTGGRLSFEERQGEKGDFLEVKVLNEQAKLAGIVWFFGQRRAYIEDIRLMVSRKETQKIDMVLLAGEGTTSAGKKELKEAKIKMMKDLELLKAHSPRKKKTKLSKKKKEKVSIDDDVVITETPDSPLISLAQTMIQRREPDIIKIREIKGSDIKTFEARGYTSNNDVLAIYRTVDTQSIGVKVIRSFYNSVDDEISSNVPIAIIAPDKFTSSAKKEASELNINLISEREERETKGSEEQQLLNSRLRAGAIEIIEQRGYTIIKKTSSKFMKLLAGSESLGTYIVAEGTENATLLVLLPAEEVVRVATVREFKKQMETMNIIEGMLIPLKRFTYTAEREAKDSQITALKKNHPVFNIFSHHLVPEHTKMTPEEIDIMLDTYHSKIAQLPKIYEDDPGVVAVNGKIGDVIRITRSVDTENYRLVIPRPDSGLTESTAILDMVEERRERQKKKAKIIIEQSVAKKAEKKATKKVTKKTTKKATKKITKKTTKKAAKKITKKTTKKAAKKATKKTTKKAAK
ncbi:MAG: DNA-directed RNA polymerase subunit H [Candidatus Heimdallarchaeota archaeon LC_2]|nr:MAG: DNA-directed RNA polymerase subunit H [Candidatus Heimdallarchaeota archaeon LC_2]